MQYYSTQDVKGVENPLEPASFKQETETKHQWAKQGQRLERKACTLFIHISFEVNLTRSRAAPVFIPMCCT